MARKSKPAPAAAAPPVLESADVHDDSDGAAMSLPIVGIGASAGGLEAFQQLFRTLPADSGAGFVVIQHLAAARPSMLAEILARATPMPVVEVQDEPLVEPNHVYVIPPDRDMTVAGGRLRLRPRKKEGAVYRPIDQFFRSLAADSGQNAIGVVLSGTGTDGTLGLQEIKAEGGITFAQDATAQHDGMPRSAIASGSVDFVLSPDEIAAEIVRVIQYAAPDRAPAGNEEARAALATIIETLRAGTGVDFTGYKGSTLHRRITRRMVLQKLDRLSHYASLIAKSPNEVEALYQDILISVTSFFRNPELFESLKTNVFPRLVHDRSPHTPVGVWALGCSTGEEAYSLAIAYNEFAETTGTHVPIQIFATDLNGAGIDKARAGVYAKSIDQDVSPERLRRFFSEIDGHYRIAKPIRDTTVFARHNILADPPFSHMDLISCRNMLIYLDSPLQKKVVPLLHYALNTDGALALGSSETIGSFRDLFEVDDARQKIFRRKPGPSLPGVGFGGRRAQLSLPNTAPALTREPAGEPAMDKQADRMLLTKYAPPSVLIDAEMNIVQVRGDTGPYLTPAPGKASLNLLKMAREGLPAALRAAIQKARNGNTSIREEGLKVRANGGFRQVSIEVVPMRSGTTTNGFLVLFEEPRKVEAVSPARKAHARKKAPAAEESLRQTLEEENARLTQELTTTREYLQSVIEQQDAANEELQSANEEAQSANEELQSVNEELETSKEEIQSSDEELATVNDELQNRNTQLNELTNDLLNLIANVRAPIVMLGRDLRIRRFNPIAEKTLNLTPTDVGRPITDMKLGLDVPDLPSMLIEVIDSVAAKEVELQDRSDQWYLLRILPYKTLDNRIDGAVMMFVDVDAIKRAQHYAESIVTTVRHPLVVLDAELRVTTANPAYYAAFHATPQQIVGRRFYDLANREWDIPALRQLLEDVLSRERFFEDFLVEDDFEHIGRKILRVNARRLARGPKDPPLILLAIEDVTERTQLQRITDVSLGTAPIDDLLREIARRVCETLGTDSCSVLLFDDDDAALRIRVAHGMSDEAAARIAAALSQGTTVATTRAPLVIDDLDRDPSFGPAFNAVTKSLLVVPILSAGELHGLLTAGCNSRRHFTDHELQLMPLAAERIAQALDREARLVAERKAKEAAESESRAKDEFFAAVSHELRTPMTSILGWTQLLEHTAFDPEMVPKAIEQIEQGARTQARLIDDMFDVSRITVGQLMVRFEPVDLRRVVDDAVHAAEPVAGQRGIRIEAQLDAATVSGDATRLGQVFANLLSNAIKFSPPDSRIHVVSTRDGDRVTISVSDEGKGIVADFLPRLFHRFSQQEKGQFGGLGLGLSIAHHLVQRHGGMIEAESEGEGKGATFRVTLPLAG